MLTPYVIARSMFDEVFDSAFSNRSSDGMMNTDIRENDEGYELIIDLPGVNREDLSAELKDGHLIISATVGQKKDGDTETNGKYLRRERFVGSFKRSFYVGDKVQKEDIHPKFENGILSFTVPKEQNTVEENSHYIAIEG